VVADASDWNTSQKPSAFGLLAPYQPSRPAQALAYCSWLQTKHGYHQAWESNRSGKATLFITIAITTTCCRPL
jgi:hypothetical protein